MKDTNAAGTSPADLDTLAAAFAASFVASFARVLAPRVRGYVRASPFYPPATRPAITSETKAA